VYDYDLLGNMVSVSNVLAEPASSLGSAPRFVTAASDGAASLSASVPVVDHPGYQWLANGSAIVGATNDSLQLAGLLRLNFQGVVTAQGENPPNETANNAFDGRYGTKWLDFANQHPGTRSSWINYQYPDQRACTVSRYMLTSANDAPERDPADWQLLASNDRGTTWTLLDTRSNEVFAARLQTRMFSCGNTNGYNTYRLQISRVSDPTTAIAVQLAEIALIGQPNFSDLGDYQVIASNRFGSVTSAVMTVSFDTDHDGLPDAWEVQYFGNLAQTPWDDFDGDGVSNYDEYIDGTDPTDPTSLLPRLRLAATSRGSVTAAPLKAKYALNETVQVSASADPGNAFIGWVGSVTNGAATLSLVMDGCKSIRGVFGAPLGWAVDAPGLTWRTGGDAGWFGQAAITYDGYSAAQSGIIYANQATWVETSVNAGSNALVSFHWMVSSETNNDFLTFYTNGVQAAAISGVSGWLALTCPLAKGTNLLRWVYSKNATDYGATYMDTAWLDRVEVAGSEQTGPVANGIASWGDRTNVPPGMSAAIAIAAGSSHDLVLNSNGTVGVWGNNSWGQTNIPRGLSNAVAIAAGFGHNLALKADGTVVAWGLNTQGQTNVPVGLSNVIAIAAGAAHNLAVLSDGTVSAWGNNAGGQINVPPCLSNVVAVAGGGSHSLALLSDGTVAGWGANSYGQAAPPPGMSNVVALAAGDMHSLALRSDGTVVAWGYNYYGQTNVPSGVSNAVAVGAGDGFSVALLADGTVAAWGNNRYGQANVPKTLTNVVDIAARSSHTLALVRDPRPFVTRQPLDQTNYSGTPVSFRVAVAGRRPFTYQWQHEGADLVGATDASLTITNATAGDGGAYIVLVNNSFGSSASLSAMLTLLTGPPVLLSQSAGGDALHGADTILSANATGSRPLGYQWERNGVDLPGATDASFTLSNLQSDGACCYAVVVTNAWGSATSAPVAFSVSDSLLAAWGRNDYGQANPPLGLTNVLAVAGGRYHSLALKADGTVAAWGKNSDGQATVPADLTQVTAIAAGWVHSAALRRDGTVVAWGSDTYGGAAVTDGLDHVTAIACGFYQTMALISDGSIVVRGGSAPPQGLKPAVAIAAGYEHCLALLNDGTVAGWGRDIGGETRPPSGLNNVVAVAAGDQYSLALRTDGKVVAWGYNSAGQTSVPSGLSNVVAIAAGAQHCLALRGDGTIVAWGLGTNGQALVPANVNDVAAIACGGYHSLALRTVHSPSILAQPASQASYTGADAFLSAAVVGGAPMRFQWRLNGVDIPGAANPVLSLSHLQLANSGSYSLVISNAYGSAISSNAQLLVSAAAPIIVQQPINSPVAHGENATLTVVASGSRPISYQWKFNGADIIGATNGSIVITNAQLSNACCYSVALKNDYGETRSANTSIAFSSTILAWGDNSEGQTRIPHGLPEISAVAAGGFHSLALTRQGTVVAWGDGTHGQTNIPSGLTNVVAIAAGPNYGYYSLALTSDGRVVAWGNNGRMSPPAGLTNVAAISAGDAHCLALRTDGKVLAWGNNDYGQTEVPAGLNNVVAIRATKTASLALTGEGKIVAWGDDSISLTSAPTGLSNVVAIAAGDEHGLALTSDGALVTWGSDVAGATDVPTGLTNVAVLEAGGFTSLALRTDGTVVAWGRGASAASNALAGAGNIVAVSQGLLHGLALWRDGPPVVVRQPCGQTTSSGRDLLLRAAAVGLSPLTYQWRFNGADISGGTDSNLRLGDVLSGESGNYSIEITSAAGSVTSANALLAIADSPPLILDQPSGPPVFAGGDGWLTVIAEGAAPLGYQWRFNGTNLVDASNSTLSIANARPETACCYDVVLSNAFGALTSAPVGVSAVNSIVVGWSSGDSGAVPITGLRRNFVPHGLTNVSALSSRGSASLALNRDGTVIAWGSDDVGQADVPQGLIGVRAVAEGGGYSLALRSDGSVAAWGSMPNMPADLNNVAAIAAGPDRFIALKNDGKVGIWGNRSTTNVPPWLCGVQAIAAADDGSLALLNNGSVVSWHGDTLAGNEIPEWTNIVAIAAGASHNLGLRSDGTLIATGNYYGLPPGLSNVVAIAAEGDHSLALREDGTVVAFGWNFGWASTPLTISNAVGIAGAEGYDLALLNNSPLVLCRQPASEVAYSGTAVMLNVGAVGQPPFAWQWRLNGINLPGETDATLRLASVSTGDAGDYSVVVQNAAATQTSSTATLTVVDSAPQIVVRPAASPLPWGTDSTLSIKAIGSGPLAYQWQLNGIDVAGATNLTLTITNAQPETAGSYSARVSNALGTNFTTPILLGPAHPASVVAWGDNSKGQTNVPAGLTNLLAMASGGSHCLALKNDRTVVAWGNNLDGQASVPAGLADVTAISGGWAHSLALKSDGTVAAWGKNTDGETRVPTDLTNATAIAAGFYHNLALTRDGTVVAWGLGSSGQTLVPAAVKDVIAVAAGAYHNLALTREGKVIAWGSSTYGATVVPAGLSNVTAVAAGYFSSLALKGDGTVVVWGTTASGQTNLPAGLTNLLEVSAGYGYYLGLKTDGTVAAWGSDGKGQTDIPLGLGNVVGIAGGGDQSLALVNDGSPFVARQPQPAVVYLGSPFKLSTLALGYSPLAYQWKFNGENIAAATNADLLVPSATWRSAGIYTLLISNLQGMVLNNPISILPLEVAVWGDNGYGQYNVPSAVKNPVATSAGALHSVALGADGTVAAWGCDLMEELNVPSGASNVVSVSCGAYHNLALLGDNRLLAWGYAGDGETVVPTGLRDLSALRAGAYHNLGLRTDGTVVAWGLNSDRQASVPYGLREVDAIAAGGYHSLALRRDGTVVAWGWNGFGEASVPTALTNAVSIAAGEYHNLALQSDGTLIAWGDNTYGQTSPPTGLSNLVAIAAGAFHSLALRADGALVAWGANGAGQSDVPAGLRTVFDLAGGRYHSVVLLNEGSPVVKKQPRDFTCFAGLDATFDALVVGTPQLGYQWQLHGTDLPGATSARLLLKSVQSGDVGPYRVIITNGIGMTTSQTAMLRLADPYIQREPSDQTIDAGKTGGFSVVVLGTSPLHYQWRKNGAILPESMASSMTVSNVQFGDVGYYDVLVSNSQGAVTSAVAKLMVNLRPIFALNSGGLAAGSFSADRYYAGGDIYSVTNPVDVTAVPNPAPQAVYQTERYGAFSYTLGSLTPGAAYTVRLHFAENVFTNAHARVFDLYLNGNIALPAFDVFVAAGARFKAIAEEILTSANDAGHIIVSFVNQVGDAKVNGIEVYQAIPAAPTDLMARIEAAHVALSWAGIPGAKAYYVRRGDTSGGPYEWIGMTADTNYADALPLAQSSSYYVVSAVNEAGESGDSNESGVAPQVTPPNLGWTVGADNFTLFWAGSASEYTLYSATNLSFPILWQQVTNAPENKEGMLRLTLPIANSGVRFFRLGPPNN